MDSKFKFYYYNFINKRRTTRINKSFKKIIIKIQKNKQVIFYLQLFGKISDKEGKINFKKKSINRINEKIIKRSPHVFKDKVVNTPKEASDI